MLRLPYLALTGVLALIRLLPTSNTDKDSEILVLRHQLTILQRQVPKPRLTPPDRAFLAALLHRIRPTTPHPQVRTAHVPFDRFARHHSALASRPPPPSPCPSIPAETGRQTTHRPLHPTLVLRLAHENPSWGYRRIHSELAGLAIKIAPSTVWEILKTHSIDPAPRRSQQTWATFLRSQAHAILAADLFEARTLTGTRLFVLAAIEHATRRIRILGATAHPTAAWTTQLARNLMMDLQDAGASAVKYLIRDRDSKYTAAFDTVLADSGITTVTTGIRVPRMNAIMERWIRTCRTELLDRTLILNQPHLLHALREYEGFYNQHRPHHALHGAAPQRPLPPPITEPHALERLDIRRQDRLGGVLHEYHHAA